MLGFLCYLVLAGAGLSALFAPVPAAYIVVKFAGAAYLLWLAWTMLRPGNSPFEPREMAAHSPTRLFTMGLVTNLLNPKIALMYAALVPQFLDSSAGPRWQQFLTLGGIQIVTAVAGNLVILLAAARLSGWLRSRPRVLRAQRVVSGTVLGGFAIGMATGH
jgi:threonine/homoserine/homoserine lactone efflux protein